VYKGSRGNDVAFYVYDGPHDYPSEAGDAIIRFFKQHSQH